MTWFKRNTEEKTEEAPQATVAKNSVSEIPQSTSAALRRDLSHILKHPRITEKATMQQGMSVYTFDVAERATKREIISAVRAIYKVIPRKVAIVSVPSKMRRSMRTGKRGVSHGGKKAYVYLTKGETIGLA